MTRAIVELFVDNVEALIDATVLLSLLVGAWAIDALRRLS